ncbi:MAG: NYN domain-containing protein [Candidatus Electrothrix sp. AW1]|nr:NYN domain-containing protein [Candidatus Electrothrix sp. AX1]MCI5181741.1 NYN domain-containing protein [Candidatus Electrothrix gigas]MCI5225917.1 NYN domain-containing protein [Candidatus Electrothrix gigas]
MNSQSNKIALLIDADNISHISIELILTELAKHGVVTIRRAYGNWTKTSLKGWEGNVHEYAIQPIQQYDLIKGKNAADMALIIDAMDILYTKNVSAFCIASSDSDYTPLVTRIIAEGKIVIGVGDKKTPRPFVAACSKFVFADAEKDAESATETEHDNTDATNQPDNTANKLKGDAKLISTLRSAIAESRVNGEWVPLSTVGTYLSKHASFAPKKYGCSCLSDLMKQIDLFELKRGKGQNYVVRDVRKK